MNFHCDYMILSSLYESDLAVCREVVGVPRLLAPGALDRVPVDVGVVHGDYGVRRRLLRRKPGIKEMRLDQKYA